MKTFLFRLIAIALIFGCSLNVTQAQTPFNQNSKIVHAGLGLGGFSIGNCYNPLPAISVSYDQGLIDNLGVGNLGIGGILAIKRYNYDCSNIDFSVSQVFVGARGHYHFDFVNSDDFDFYVGAQAGVFFYTGDTDNSFNNYKTNIFPGAFAGINYWFTPTFGIYAEAGYGLGLLNGGVAFGF